MGKKPIIVTLKKTKHKTQPWTVEVDIPGPGPNDGIKGRYCRLSVAKRGVFRKLERDGWKISVYDRTDVGPDGVKRYLIEYSALRKKDDRPIKFVTKPSKR